MAKKEKKKRKPAEQVEPDLSNPFTGLPQYDFGALQNIMNPQLPPDVQAIMGGGGDQRQLLELLRDRWAQEDELAREQMQATQDWQVRPEELYQSYTKAVDPRRYAQNQYEARLATDPWGPGGAFEGRRAADRYTPEAILASQGNTAENQIARMGGRKGVDPEELKRMNRQYAANRTYYG